MTAVELLTKLRRANVKVWAEGEQLRCSAPGGALTADLRAELSARKTEVLSFLRAARTSLSPATPPLVNVPRGGDLPLSFAQQRLWFLDRLEPGSAAYNIPTAVRLTGALNLCALTSALTEVARRHESLRTRFEDVSGRPVQVVTPATRIALPLVDLTLLSASERTRTRNRLLRENALAPFALAHGALLRVRLIRESADASVLSAVMHHIIGDAWSTGVLVRELTELYRAYEAGRPSPLAELPVQYADYAAWQHRCLNDDALRGELAYWRERLAGTPAELNLLTDRPRGAASAGSSRAVTVALDVRTSQAVQRLCLTEGATPFMLLLTAFKALLYRYTGQTDLVVGTPVAGRARAELEGLVGFFVNTLALRTKLADETTFVELLRRVRETCLGAFSHQHVPFERLVEELTPERSVGRNPLCQVFFTLGNKPNGAGVGGAATGLLGRADGQAQALGETTGAPAKFDLTLYLTEVDGAFRGALQYDTRLFDEATMRRLARHYERLVETAVAEPARAVAELPLLDAAELRTLLTDWNETTTAYPHNACIHQLFEQQAARTPDAVAVSDGQRQLTYGELDRLASRLAAYLRRRGVGPDVFVGVCLERSLDLIVALVGVLKAGGAYVPLDAQYPRERLRLMLKDTRLRVLLTQQSLAAQLPHSKRLSVCLDSDWPKIAKRWRQAARARAPRADNLAYVIYTSGSTGRPKGVMVTHRNVVRLVRETNYAEFDAAQTFLQFAPISFDASTFEIWGALLNGARLEVFPPHTPTLSELAHELTRRRVTTLWLTAGLFHQMTEQQPDALARVRQLLAGGDVLSAPHLRKLLTATNSNTVINGYGPTESTTFACTHRMTADATISDSVPIGRPIANTCVYVLDRLMQPALVGAAGELFIGGDGLARGYLNRPELTAERFVPDPYGPEPGARLYRTGDVVKYLPAGDVEFMGRADNQIKVRGFRVEPGEIEAVLRATPGIEDVAVVTRADRAGGRRLVAYVVLAADKQAGAKFDSARLRDLLKRRLPEYMIPSAFAFVPELPLTPNGKVDRAALPEVEPTAERVEHYVAPRDTLEHRLVLIWEETLGARRIGINDNFFELGGHSMLAVRLMAEVRKWLGVELPLATLFHGPSVAQLATAIREQTTPAPPSPLVAIQPHGSRPPFFCVHPGSGDIFYYVQWARHLGSDQPFYGLQDPKLFVESEVYTPLAEMATAYIAALRAAQPKGPYRLGGWSFGGHVAYEMARQLRARGEEVTLLLIIDTGAPAYVKQRFEGVDDASLLAMLALESVPAGKSFGELTAELRRLADADAQVQHVVEYLRAHGKASALPMFAENFMKRAFRLFASRVVVLRDYEPEPYAGQITLLRATDRLLESDEERADETWGWDKLATGVRVRSVPGNHATLGKEPHVRVLVEHLRACLDAAL